MTSLNLLINRCIDNDRKAQQALYEKHFQFLMSICYRYEHNQQDAVALVNQAFLKIISNLNSFNQSKPFLPWIKRIAVNESIDHIRKQKRLYGNVVFLDDEAWENECDITEDEIAELPALDYEDYISMMDELDEPCKTIFNLYAIDDYQHGKIAELLGISERTSKRYLSKAREALREMIMARNKLMRGA